MPEKFWQKTLQLSFILIQSSKFESNLTVRCRARFCRSGLLNDTSGTVKLIRKSRMDFSRLPFLLIFLGLGLSVFGWGLQYKLSLYDPPQATSHQMPQAKLLSQDEQATAIHTPLTAKNPVKIFWAVLSSAVFFFVLAFDLYNSLASSQTVRETNRPWCLHFHASLNAFFFRPPPILA